MDNFVFFMDERNRLKISLFKIEMIFIFIVSFIILLVQVFLVFIPSFKKMTAQKNRLYQLSFDVSHQLRKPLANVLGALTLIDDDMLTMSERNLINIIRSESLKIDNIIRKQSIIIEQEETMNFRECENKP